MWFYAKDDRPIGPISEEEMTVLIRDGVVTSSTLVWKKGMADWQDAAGAGLLARAATEGVVPPALPTGPNASAGDMTLAVLTHILCLFAGFLAPLVVLLATRNRYVKDNARRAMNWQISWIIYILIAFLLSFVLIGIPILFILIVLQPIFCIIAAAKAANGEAWKYPMAIPFTGR